MSLDGTTAPRAIDSATAAHGQTERPEGAAGAEGQRLARLAQEFESMLLVQMLREMRKSGSWRDENDDSAGYGAETLFETIDVELASYITKVQGFGLEKSLMKQITGGGPAAPVGTLPLTLPTLDLPTSEGAGRVADSVAPRSVDEGAGRIDLLADRAQTSPFGWRRDPFSGAATYHRGVDLRAAYGEPIGAADAGTVVFAGEQGGYGQTVVVEHAGGVRTRYAHLSSLATEAGATVRAGDPVGRAGRSGRATGTHLHFEVTRDGQPVDPHSFMAGGLKVDGVTADWGSGNGPTLPGVASDGSVAGHRSAERGSGAD